MFKITAILVLAICVYGVQGSCGPPCKHSSRTICAADRHIKNCQRMTQCQLDQENCRRRASKHPTISNVAGSRCRKLKHPGGKGPCASAPRPRSYTKIDCNRVKCHSTSHTTVCARSSRHNLCQRLTKCQLQRINCRRGRSNRLALADSHHCAGMKSGQKLEKCKKLPKKV